MGPLQAKKMMCVMTATHFGVEFRVLSDPQKRPRGRRRQRMEEQGSVMILNSDTIYKRKRGAIDLLWSFLEGLCQHLRPRQ